VRYRYHPTYFSSKASQLVPNRFGFGLGFSFKPALAFGFGTPLTDLASAASKRCEWGFIGLTSAASVFLTTSSESK